ncbi:MULTISPECIES: bacteriocin [Nostoc]|jgi:bacteriocin-like protein|uniref:Bacteriocin n=1 Tax=Nostoc punctiforme FACHB-252 TaxID=1357509 RepID=A0ABR8HA33_NOSPU|nr:MULTISPECIES: bacteriocin [Nostoc]MBC1236971.1 bacteriocin [Nostoc sp. 2RC]MBD2611938.1 bacteriocin [Nostoc punctiforme FACHB-252]MBL1203031.1 bacteriocin [Nostoc sp. GBBB01]MDZ8013517.1 bacteriocin [Nostoc sp. ZfuVER08]
MANIKLHDLSPAGSELFEDSESFLNELNTEELTHVNGGLLSITITITITITVTLAKAA